MKYLFVFLLVGLTSVVNSQTAKQPDCDTIIGFHTTDYDLIPDDYTGIVFKSRDCKVWGMYNYKDGKKEGLRRNWYENGQLYIEQNWKDGELDGLYRDWYESGKLRLKQNWKDDKRVGKHREWWESSGKLKVEYPYSESGDGQWDGWYYEYYEDGDVMLLGKMKGCCHILYVKKIGIWRYYYDTDYNKGQKSKKEVYTETGDGVLISKKCWDEDGNVIQCP